MNDDDYNDDNKTTDYGCNASLDEDDADSNDDDSEHAESDKDQAIPQFVDSSTWRWPNNKDSHIPVFFGRNCCWNQNNCCSWCSVHSTT